jgi:O-antigen/teichoic acid export membrane protein
MSIVHKKSFSGVIISYTGIMIGTFIIIILLPKFFSPEEFGLRSFIFDLSLILAQLFMAGLSGSIIKYYPKIKKSSNLKGELLIKSLGIVFILFVFTLLLFTLFKSQIISLFENQSPLASNYFIYGIFLGFTVAIFQILETYSRNIHSFNYSRFLRDIVFRVFSIILIFFFGLNYINMSSFWNLTILSYIIISLILLFHISERDSLKFEIKSLWRKPKQSKEISTYSTFSLLSSSSSMFLSRIDAIMITVLIGLESTAIYSMVIFISILIETPRKILSQVISPLISTALNNSDQEQLDMIYKKTSETLTLVGTFSLAIVWVNLDLLFSFITNGQLFATGKTAFLLLAFAKIIDMFFSCNNEILSYSKEYKQNFISNFLLILISIISNYLLIPTWGLTGAAAATLGSVIAFNIYKAIITPKIKIKITRFLSFWRYLL